MTVTSSKTGEKPLGVEFALGALAAVGAGLFTNPIEVVKIRLQLQGELEARGHYKKIYRNTFHAAYLIAKHEGIFALQAGIGPALGFQVALNGLRLGIYNIALRQELIVNKDGNTDIIKTILVTGFAGCTGAALGSPLYMVKTQLQAQSASESIAVGHQHQHKSAWSAFRVLWKEGGFRALYRGWHAGIPRIFVGSAAQLTTFSLASDYLRPMAIFKDRPILMTFCASLMCGNAVAIVIQPFDVLATRLYNQHTVSSNKGALYDGLFDAFKKIMKTEGLLGLYKGVFPTWLRIAPHSVLCLVFYKELDELYMQMTT